MPPSTLERMGLQYNCVETVMSRANGSMGNILWNRSTEEELAKYKRPYTRGGKKSLRKIGDFVKHVFREHNREADHCTNIGAEGQRKIVIDRCRKFRDVEGGERLLRWQRQRKW